MPTGSEVAGEPSPTADGVESAASGAWRPAPFPFSGSRPFLDRAELSCRAADNTIGDTQAVLRDVRGEGFIVFVFASSTAAWACFAPTSATTPADVVVRALEIPAELIGDENLDLVLYEGQEVEAGGVRTVALGRVGRAGVRVVASFDDESEVEATKSGGWWAMWWPTDVDAATVAVVDRQSIAIDALPIPRR